MHTNLMKLSRQWAARSAAASLQPETCLAEDLFTGLIQMDGEGGKDQGVQQGTATPVDQNQTWYWSDWSVILAFTTWTIYFTMFAFTLTFLKSHKKRSAKIPFQEFVAPSSEDLNVEYQQRGYKNSAFGKFLWHFWTKWPVFTALIIIFLIVIGTITTAFLSIIFLITKHKNLTTTSCIHKITIVSTII